MSSAEEQMAAQAVAAANATVRPAGIPANALVDANGFIMTPGHVKPDFPWPDIGHLAKWSVSSFKFGFGPECLRDDDSETFWHSDGPQPHAITVQFPRKVPLQKIGLHLSFTLDDSYTPATLSVRAGTGLNDLQDVRLITFDKPNGWITFDAGVEPREDGEGFKPVEAYVLQILIMTNHLNGKDTHLRGLRVYGPLEKETADEDPFPFVTRKFKLYETLR